MAVVNRCVCWDLTFDELKARAQETGATFEELSEQTGCSTGCGMCAPYVRKMLETGQTAFPLMPAPRITAPPRGGSPRLKPEP